MLLDLVIMGMLKVAATPRFSGHKVRQSAPLLVRAESFLQTLQEI